MTPKTPPDVRATHERLVRMVSERVQLRDITASLKNLLESPETRSYEYAIAVLSAAAPVHPDVRKALLLPERTPSRFLRGYPLVAAIMLALLVAARASPLSHSPLCSPRGASPRWRRLAKRRASSRRRSRRLAWRTSPSSLDALKSWQDNQRIAGAMIS